MGLRFSSFPSDTPRERLSGLSCLQTERELDGPDAARLHMACLRCQQSILLPTNAVSTNRGCAEHACATAVQTSLWHGGANLRKVCLSHAARRNVSGELGLPGTCAPNPISSASMPFRLLLCSDTSHRNPAIWYSFNCPCWSICKHACNEVV